MKKDNSKTLILACALGLGLGLSLLLPLGTSGSEIVKGGPQMMKPSQPYVTATERKTDTGKAVLAVHPNCCTTSVPCGPAKHSHATDAEKK